MKRLYLVIFIVLMIGLFSACSQAQQSQTQLLDIVAKDGVLYAGEGWSTSFKGINVVYYSGTPEEIGQQQGLFILDTASEEQQTTFAEMKNQMKTGNYFVDLFRDLYAKFQIIPTFKRYIPEEYLQELKGMKKAVSDGESEDIDDFLMANAMQDLGLVMGCSVVSVWGDSTKNNELLVGRNLDHTGFYDMAQSQYLAFYNPQQGNKFVALNYPVNVGLMQGMNEKGLVIAMTYSMVGKEEMTIKGLPYIIMLRHVLQYASDIDEAISMIKETPRTIGINIMLASAEDKKAVVLETSANRLQIRNEENYIYATNRYRTDYMQQFQKGGWIHSQLRDERFEELISFSEEEIEYLDVIDMMRDKYDRESAAGKGFVAGIENAGTLASMIFRPDSLKIYISNLSQMPAPEGQYVAFDCQKIWEGKDSTPVEVVDNPEMDSYNKSWLKVRKAEFAENQGDKELVEELMKPVVAEYPEAETPLVLLGVSYIKQKQLEKGIELLKRVIELPEIAYPYNKLKAYFWLGIANDIFLDDHQQAVKYYEKAVSLEIPDLAADSNQLINIARMGLKTPITVDENGVFVPEK